jgi:YidC/Oxa1 family membrane protein insertase
VFATEIADESGRPVLRIERAFARGAADASPYLLTLSHTITNLDGAPHAVQFVQYGPGDLPRDTSSMLEVRRFHFGYLFPPERDPSQAAVLANGQMFERSTVAGQISSGDFALWPNIEAREGRYSPVWFGSTDRYFALAVHSAGTGSKRLEGLLEVKSLSNGLAAPDDAIFTELWTPPATIAAGASSKVALGVYAGPLDPRILEGVEPYSSLAMGDLIVYVMAGCCSWCTFAWLADLLLLFLTLLHDHVVFDWGIAIIMLVILVRLVLHPLQKKSQISMQRFSRAMSAMKPELDALQSKFKDDPRRMQAEQMRLFREKGVSPGGCVGGMLPMFAQMPIWMALYAVLYFAFPLRHQAPFFGVFQSFGDWAFLADLSAPDNFVLFAQPIHLWLFSLSSINLLPLLMGVVFWIQQQYMTPVTPNMSEEQLAQQRMMKWMMTLMFPVMMYIVPSGLTLYIFTSTVIGIVESRIIKKQVDAMDFSKPPEKPKRKQDMLGRLYERALERAQQNDAAKKKFKER